MADREGVSSNSSTQGRDRVPAGQAAPAERLRRVSENVLAEIGGESSNPEIAIFDVLSDWETQLQAENIDFEELGL